MAIESDGGRRSGITIAGLVKLYGSLKVLNGISLDIEPGAFVALLGPSGCGKTTLLRTIAGLADASHGTIDIGDRRVVDADKGVFVPPQQRRLGMVFQHYALWPHMTVRNNICFPLRKQGFPRAEWDARIMAVAETVGLPTILDRSPSQLSGGQQQRVALARALVSEPKVLLLDEPLSNLDANLRDQLRRELRQLHDRQGTTTVLVTHDQHEAAMMADTIVVIESGSIVQVGPPGDILDRPANRFVAGFVGYDNFLAGVVEQLDGSAVQIRLSGGDVVTLRNRGSGLKAGQPATIAVRSEQLSLAGASQAPQESFVELPARVAGVQGLGRWRETYVDYAGTKLSARDLADAPPQGEQGSKVFVRIPSHSPVFVD
ncbi:ATP-binding cassette domain-containing protein [bacterium]|nr:ATP-binding cassette domain-containing protein [bacterium]